MEPSIGGVGSLQLAEGRNEECTPYKQHCHAYSSYKYLVKAVLKQIKFKLITINQPFKLHCSSESSCLSLIKVETSKFERLSVSNTP